MDNLATQYGRWHLPWCPGTLHSWGLDFTLALTFIAMVIPVLRDKPSVAAALSAGITAVIANPLPYKMGLMLAALTGIAVGLMIEGRRDER